MTSILTAASPKYIVQTSDRRLSKVERGVTSEYDPSSNKTIVYRSSDAIVSIGYSGVGYIRGVPTDEWIAECLWGETPIPRGFDGHRAVALISKPRPLRCNLGFAVRRLCSAINARHEPQRDGIYVTISGWQRKRARYRPIIVEIENSPGQRRCSLNQHPRYWTRQSSFRLTAIGARISHATCDKALAPFRGPNGIRASSGEIELALANIIRDISDHDTTVGPDVLSVVLPRPDDGTGYSRFLTAQQHHRSFEIGGTATDTGVAYSPWIMGPRLLAAPSLRIGTTRHHLGGIDFDVIGFAQTGPLAFLMSSHQRPPPP
jgi:hypothetical protein